MSEKITQLTPEQEAQMIDFREEWRKHGLSTEPIDKEKAASIITEMYKEIGKEQPKFIFCESPLEAQKAMAKYQAVWDHFSKFHTSDQKVFAATNAFFDDPDSEPKLKKSLDNIKVTYQSTDFHGSMDAYWICFYEFPEKYLGIKYQPDDSRKLKMWSDLAKCCGWFWPREMYCFVSDRPEVLSFNPRNRLHCEDGPAIRYRCGWELYYWNGVQVPKEWILAKGSITKKVVTSEKNAEKRRVLREILGATAYFEVLGGVVVLDEDTDNQGYPMRLLETKQPDEVTGNKVQFLECICPSTQRMYNIYPPSQRCTNVWAAKADTFGKEEKDFKPVIET